MKKNNNIKSVLKEALIEIKPLNQELKDIGNSARDFSNELRKRIKKLKLDVEVFIGGSFAKKTMIKKNIYDVDFFLRFDKIYGNDKISDLTERILSGIKKDKVHGSRDYFRVEINRNFLLEIIPVLKVRNPRDSENITDLSYSHVKYIKRKLKAGKILDEVKLAKAFCYASGCYGAESYIKGFSGYAIELLVYHYGSFLKFLQGIGKIMPNKERIVIDIEKQFRNKREVLMNLNSSKLNSPIILIDPTYKNRNVLAALSQETFEKFKDYAEKFLKKPDTAFFKQQKVNLEKLKSYAKKKNFEFALLESGTNRQEGDIAGSKLLKFYNHLAKEIEKYFYVEAKGIEYNGKKSARYFFVAKKRKEIIFHGPEIKDEESAKKFKGKHKDTFIKSGRFYAREKINFSLKKFLDNWKRKNKKLVGEMSVVGMELLK